METSNFFQQLREELVFGSIAGLGICVVGHPFDTIKTRRQVIGGSYLKMIPDMIAKEGPLSFYKGMASPLITIPVINSIVFGSYSLSLTYFNQLPSIAHESEDRKLLYASLFSGFMAAIVTAPVELFKTKLQLQGEGKARYKGNVHLARHIYRTSRVSGFFQGTYLTIYRDILGYGFQFTTYHKLVRYFAEKEGSNE